MSYQITCNCGNAIELSAAQAGSSVKCTCGEFVEIPTLSQLRKMAGKGAYEAGIIDTINRMIKQKELPWGNTCIVSGITTDEVQYVHILCETKHFKQSYVFQVLVVVYQILLMPIYLFLTLLEDKEDSDQDYGYFKGVNVPLRITEEQFIELKSIKSQARLRQLLSSVPIYAQLFDEYPDAVITV